MSLSRISKVVLLGFILFIPSVLFAQEDASEEQSKFNIVWFNPSPPKPWRAGLDIGAVKESAIGLFPSVDYTFRNLLLQETTVGARAMLPYLASPFGFHNRDTREIHSALGLEGFARAGIRLNFFNWFDVSAGGYAATSGRVFFYKNGGVELVQGLFGGTGTYIRLSSPAGPDLTLTVGNVFGEEITGFSLYTGWRF